MKLGLIYKQKLSYILVYFLLLLHFAGGGIANIAIFLTSAWMFYYIVLVRKWDLYLVFILLIPTIVLSTEPDPSAASVSSWTSNLKNVWIIGPFAMSTSFMLALAIPFRLLMDFGRSRFKSLTTLWYLTLFLATCGLLLAFFVGDKNPSGLTVGFRITLTLGAIFIHKAMEDKKALLESLDKIILVSFLLLLLGVMRGHWVFVTFGFIPYFWHRIRPRLLSLLPLIYSIYIFRDLTQTITIMGILLVSISFYFFISRFAAMRRLLLKKVVILLILIMPILVTAYTLSLDARGEYDIKTLKGLAEFKLLGDRKPIWDASWDDIWSSSFLVKPAGGKLMVYFDYIKEWQEWTPGSHNIFLEMGRQIGAFPMLSLSFLIIFSLYSAGKFVAFKGDLILLYCFIAVYLVFGLTGQTLIYDGVGGLFWLLFGQFFQMLIKDRQEELETFEQENSVEPALPAKSE